MDDTQTTRPSLLARVRDTEDREAWAEFVEVYSPFVYGFMRRHGLQDADAAVIVTKHKQYYELDLEWLKGTMRTPILIDGRNVFDAEEVRAAGFAYKAIGKG